jgi:hypothetical protein
VSTALRTLKFSEPARLPASTAPKILFYSHDTFGLGNIRRTLLLSQTLRSDLPHAAMLVVTGSPMIHAFNLPDNLDYIKLPCLDTSCRERSTTVPVSSTFPPTTLTLLWNVDEATSIGGTGSA